MEKVILIFSLLSFLLKNISGQTNVWPASNSGPVGIGTLSPVFQLDVNGTGTVANFGNGTTGGIKIGDGFISKSAGSGWVWGSGMIPDGDNVRYFGHALNRWGEVHIGNAAYSQISGVRFATDGKVGIGTTSPATQLHTNSSGGFSSGVRITSTASGSYSNLTLMNDQNVESQLLLTGSTLSAGNLFGPNELALTNGGSGGIHINTFHSTGVIRFGAV
jgi:hypothetical protein